MAEPASARPKNVVIVDAENPLVEVRGEFFWREDHEQLLAAACEQAYRAGFADGFAQASARPSVVVRSRRRRRPFTRLLFAVALTSFVLAVLVTVVQVIAFGWQ
ncbi:MAG: hypothetical protein ABI776_18340 [Nocardioidaceae bacterium]